MTPTYPHHTSKNMKIQFRKDFRLKRLTVYISSRRSPIRGLLQVMVFAFLAVLPGDVHARFGVPTEPLKLFVDFARYRGDTQHLYVEFYYSFSQKSLTYRPDSAGFSAGVDMTLIVRNGDSVVYGDRWVVPHHLSDSSTFSAAFDLVAVSALELRSGDYVATIVGRDLHNPASKDSVLIAIPIRMIDSSRVVVSDLELASEIRQGNAGTSFFKNTFEVIPTPKGIYTQDQVCFYYAEMYNLLAGEDRQHIVVRTGVRDAVGREVITREKQRKRGAESGILVDQIAVNKLRTGTYTLSVALLDSGKRVLTSSAKKFFVYNPSLGIDSSLTSSPGAGFSAVYAAMNEPELDREFTFAIYESTEDEEHRFKELSGVESKSTFLEEFWKRRPEGLRKEYLERVAYSNQNLRVLGREGYKTDRGRVHVVYGPPDDIERHPNEPDSKPYEIWSYNNIQGGVIFVFVQRISGGQYELVHSTHRNELRDDLWKSRYADTAR